jgi:hypothetical protein
MLRRACKARLEAWLCRISFETLALLTPQDEVADDD